MGWQDTSGEADEFVARDQDDLAVTADVLVGEKTEPRNGVAGLDVFDEETSFWAERFLDVGEKSGAERDGDVVEDIADDGGVVTAGGAGEMIFDERARQPDEFCVIARVDEFPDGCGDVDHCDMQIGPEREECVE